MARKLSSVNRPCGVVPSCVAVRVPRRSDRVVGSRARGPELEAAAGDGNGWRGRAGAGTIGLPDSAWRRASDKLKAGVADLWDSKKCSFERNRVRGIWRKDAGLRESGRGGPCGVWDQKGRPSEDSPVAFWEMGLLAKGEWRGLWIGSQMVGGPKTEAPAPFLRKSFRTGGREAGGVGAAVCDGAGTVRVSAQRQEDRRLCLSAVLDGLSQAGAVPGL